ncbi:Uma2 family endonuclease [Euzebya tangerina]|uniref:Uma2 family endonuclease n=1 Tax=Euzebya tangerina TaxID=591198 RepID=UPI002F35BE89
MIPTALADLPEDAFRPLRRVEFQAMVDQGLFEGTNVELVGGVLVEMSQQGQPHSQLIRLLTRLIVRSVGDDYEVGIQTPLAVDEISLPEPDLQVLPAGPYWDAHPEQALLVIEVSNSSLRFDLGEKARRYAASGYPEYWVVDVEGRQIHVHRQPSNEGWRSVEIVSSGVLRSSAVPAVVVRVDELFGY